MSIEVVIDCWSISTMFVWKSLLNNPDIWFLSTLASVDCLFSLEFLVLGMTGDFFFFYGILDILALMLADCLFRSSTWATFVSYGYKNHYISWPSWCYVICLVHLVLLRLLLVVPGAATGVEWISLGWCLQMREGAGHGKKEWFLGRMPSTPPHLWGQKAPLGQVCLVSASLLPMPWALVSLCQETKRHPGLRISYGKILFDTNCTETVQKHLYLPGVSQWKGWVSSQEERRTLPHGIFFFCQQGSWSIPFGVWRWDSWFIQWRSEPPWSIFYCRAGGWKIRGLCHFLGGKRVGKNNTAMLAALFFLQFSVSHQLIFLSLPCRALLGCFLH